jgi:hypothetical protein
VASSQPLKPTWRVRISEILPGDSLLESDEGLRFTGELQRECVGRQASL